MNVHHLFMATMCAWEGDNSSDFYWTGINLAVGNYFPLFY